MKSIKNLFVCVAVSSLAITSSPAVDIGVSHDTWVREDSPDSNRNADGFINARTDIDADDNDVIFLRFPTAALSGDALSATLTLYWQRDDGSTANTLSLWGLNDGTAGETLWDETTITYNTAVGLIPDGMDPTAETAAAHDANDVRDLDIANLTLLVDEQPYGPQVLNAPYSFSSAALATFINADSNGELTFLITRGTLGTSGNQARFWQKEADGGIGAVLGVTLVPEPSALALFGLGGLAYAFRRRR